MPTLADGFLGGPASEVTADHVQRLIADGLLAPTGPATTGAVVIRGTSDFFGTSIFDNVGAISGTAELFGRSSFDSANNAVAGSAGFACTTELTTTSTMAESVYLSGTGSVQHDGAVSGDTNFSGLSTVYPDEQKIASTSDLLATGKLQADHAVASTADLGGSAYLTVGPGTVSGSSEFYSSGVVETGSYTVVDFPADFTCRGTLDNQGTVLEPAPSTYLLRYVPVPEQRRGNNQSLHADTPPIRTVRGVLIAGTQRVGYVVDPRRN